MSGATQCNGIAFALIFLGSEVQADPGRRSDLVEGRRGEIEAALSNVETHVVEGERGIVVCGTGVFTRSKEEEECKTCHVRNR